MNKQELIDAVAADVDITKKSVAAILDSIMAVITDAVASGDKVTLVGFGSFEARTRKEREGRNPKTGESLTVPATVIPVFSPGKAFKDAVEQGVEVDKAA